MEPLLVIVLTIGAAIFFVNVAAKKASARKKVVHPGASAARPVTLPARPVASSVQRATVPREPKHITPLPEGVPLVPWGAAVNTIEVVGEDYRPPENFERVVGRGIHTERGEEVQDVDRAWLDSLGPVVVPAGPAIPGRDVAGEGRGPQQ